MTHPSGNADPKSLHKRSHVEAFLPWLKLLRFTLLSPFVTVFVVSSSISTISYLPIMSGPNMHFASDQLWDNIISCVKDVVGLPEMEDSLVKQALIAAHSSDEDNYHCDGNRAKLAPMGLIAIQLCVRHAHKSGKYQGKAHENAVKLFITRPREACHLETARNPGRSTSGGPQFPPCRMCGE